MPAILTLVLLLLLMPGPLSQNGALAQGGSRLQISLWTNNTVMTWEESRLLTATVTYNGTPLQGAVVEFRSDYRGTFSNRSGHTNDDGNISTEYRNRGSYRDHDTIRAIVQFDNSTATFMLNMTIVDPPPDIIPGRDPRQSGPIMTVWACSGLGAVILVIFLAAALRDERGQGKGGG
jgi:uncharacterized GH25 family protein